MQRVINSSSLFYLVQQKVIFSFGLRPVADFSVFIISEHENNTERRCFHPNVLKLWDWCIKDGTDLKDVQNSFSTMRFELQAVLFFLNKSRPFLKSLDKLETEEKHLLNPKNEKRCSDSSSTLFYAETQCSNSISNKVSAWNCLKFLDQDTFVL